MVANCRNIVNNLLGFGLTPSNSRNSNVSIPNIVKASVLGIVVSVRNVVLFLTSFLDQLKMISRYLGIPHIIGYSLIFLVSSRSSTFIKSILHFKYLNIKLVMNNVAKDGANN